jgi:hypothetical protein
MQAIAVLIPFTVQRVSTSTAPISINFSHYNKLSVLPFPILGLLEIQSDS